MARPLSPLLSADIIIDEAMRMYADEGTITILAIAKRLGVRQSSLYNHVKGKDAIIEGIRGRLHDAMAARVNLDADWQSVIRDVAEVHRAALARYPWGIHMLATSPAQADGAITTIENLATVLRRAGFPRRDVALIIGSIDLITIGAALDANSPGELFPGEVLDRSSDLAEAVRLGPPPETRARATFQFLLDQLIVSLESRLQAHATPVSG